MRISWTCDWLRIFFIIPLFNLKINYFSFFYSDLAYLLFCPRPAWACIPVVIRLECQVIESVGNMEENVIGSNCGQMVRKYVAKQPEYEEAPA